MKVIYVPLDQIEQNENSRVIYKDNDLSELMHSMKKDGLLQPVGLRKLADKKYEAVFGNRRIISAKKLGWADIPATVVSIEDDTARDILNLVENLKRQNTTVAEDGRIFQALMDRGLNAAEIAARVGVSTVRVSTALDVFHKVPEEFRAKIVNNLTQKDKKKGFISAGAAHTALQIRKTYGLNRKHFRDLLHYASQDGSSTNHLNHIAPLLKSGWTIGDAIDTVSSMARVVMYVYMPEKQIAKLEKESKKSITTLLWEQLERNKDLQVSRMPAPQRYSGKRKLRDIRKVG